ncbi:MAG: DUF2461 domain-containing protein [Fluviicola sp.]
MFTQDYLEFFKELAANNNKDWFDLNRKRYENSVKKPFTNFVQSLINELATSNPEFKDLTPSECTFRINRDIRFSKDKTPYKLYCSAVVAPGGKKSKAINGIYFEFTPEHVNFYGGVYEADKEEILLIREGIIKHHSKFKSLYSDKKFTNYFGEILGEKNKTLPKEMKEFGENEDLLFNKQWYFKTSFPAELILEKDLIQKVKAAFEIASPIQTFFQQLINA